MLRHNMLLLILFFSMLIEGCSTNNRSQPTTPLAFSTEIPPSVTIDAGVPTPTPPSIDTPSPILTLTPVMISTPTQISLPTSLPETNNPSQTFLEVIYSEDDGVNVRTTPGYQNKPTSDIVDVLFVGDKAIIQDGPQEADELIWWKVKTSIGVLGWVAEQSSRGYRLVRGAKRQDVDDET